MGRGGWTTEGWGAVDNPTDVVVCLAAMLEPHYGLAAPDDADLLPLRARADATLAADTTASHRETHALQRWRSPPPPPAA